MNTDPDSGGHGVRYEVQQFKNFIYKNKGLNHRIFACYFSEADRQYIVDPLDGFDHFLLDGDDGYEKLLRKLINQPSFVLPESEGLPDLSPSRVEPLFSRPDSNGSTEGTAESISTTIPPETETTQVAGSADIESIRPQRPAKLKHPEHSQRQMLQQTWKRKR